MTTATATATATFSLSSLVGEKVRLYVEHPSFPVLVFNCTIELGSEDMVKLWVYDIDRTEDTAMMILHGDTQVERTEYEGVVYYWVKL